MRLVVIGLLGLLCGCATYKHQRPVVLSVVVEEGKTNLVAYFESTTVQMFLQKLSATGIKSKVIDGDYHRDVLLGKVGAAGDADFINAISEGVAQGLKKSQTGGVPIPIP